MKTKTEKIINELVAWGIVILIVGAACLITYIGAYFFIDVPNRYPHPTLIGRFVNELIPMLLLFFPAIQHWADLITGWLKRIK